MIRPKLLKTRLFCSPSATRTVSENEDNSSDMDSAVFDLNSGYRKRTIDMQNNARKEIRIRPLMASSDVHLAGPDLSRV